MANVLEYTAAKLWLCPTDASVNGDVQATTRGDQQNWHWGLVSEVASDWLNTAPLKCSFCFPTGTKVNSNTKTHRDFFDIALLVIKRDEVTSALPPTLLWQCVAWHMIIASI